MAYTTTQKQERRKDRILAWIDKTINSPGLQRPTQLQLDTAATLRINTKFLSRAELAAAIAEKLAP